MISAHTDSDFSGIGNPKVSQLFGLVVLAVLVVFGEPCLRIFYEKFLCSVSISPF